VNSNKMPHHETVEKEQNRLEEFLTLATEANAHEDCEKLEVAIAVLDNYILDDEDLSVFLESDDEEIISFASSIVDWLSGESEESPSSVWVNSGKPWLKKD